MLKLHTTESEQISIENEDADFFGSLTSGNKIVNVKGMRLVQVDYTILK